MSGQAVQSRVSRPQFAARAVLLDLDGTLLDTIPDLAEAANRTLVELGRAPIPERTIATYVGKGIPILVQRLLRAGQSDGGEPSAGELAVALAIFKRHYAATNGIAASIYPGVVAGLEAMLAAGLQLAVITNKAEDFTLPLLEQTGLRRYFALVVSGDTLEHKKPHPAPLLHACNTLGTTPGETPMIGDSINDMQAARAAGCPALCVPYGYNEGGDVRSLDCDAIVASLDDAVALLNVVQRGASETFQTRSS